MTYLSPTHCVRDAVCIYSDSLIDNGESWDEEKQAEFIREYLHRYFPAYIANEFSSGEGRQEPLDLLWIKFKDLRQVLKSFAKKHGQDALDTVVDEYLDVFVELHKLKKEHKDSNVIDDVVSDIFDEYERL